MSLEVERFERLYEWMKGRRANPFKMILFPTNKCNLKCIFCRGALYQHTWKEKDELTEKEWLEIVKWGIKVGVREWWITGGGEPLARLNVTEKIIKIIKSSKSSYCEVMTNGTLFTKDVAEKFIKLNVDKILISLDGSNFRVNDFLRGKGSFKRASNSIKLLSYLKNKLKKDKPIIRINTVINAKNYDEVVKLVILAYKIGANELSLHPMLIYNDTYPKVKDIILTDIQKRKLLSNIKKAEKMAAKYKIKFDADSIKELNKLEEKGMDKYINLTNENIKSRFLSSICFEPWYCMLIDAMGRVVPCCPAGAEKDGPNVREMTLESIWNGKFFNRFRRRMIQRKPFEICLKCGVIDLTNNLRERFIDFLKKYKLTVSKLE